MEKLHPSTIELGLERIATVAQRLGLKKPAAKVITVAGTNGKGSCVVTLQHLLTAQGRRVGAYTSPHLLSYNERVSLSGTPVQDAVLCDAFAKIDQAREDISLTYFEFGTLAAFLIFAAQDLDYWLLEVGLGGRLDAVNLLSPDIAVITSIDLDHMEWLGETREEIAYEKLGILRKGIPCVCAEKNFTANMADIFAESNTKLFAINREFAIQDHQDLLNITVSDHDLNSLGMDIPIPNLPVDSVAAALQVLMLLNELPPEAELQKSLNSLALTGRFQKIVNPNVDFVLDVAHNPAAAALLAEKLKPFSGQKIIAVIAMMADKQISETLSALIPCVDHWCVSEIENNSRSAGKDTLFHHLNESGVDENNITLCNNIEQAITIASGMSNDTDAAKPVVLVFGSFFTVAEAHEYLEEKK